MFSGKDAANPAYPTQWALNPTAYQNVDSSTVDWAALAQQWIAMKEAAAIISAPPPPSIKPDTEEGEAPMEVENPDGNHDGPDPPPGVEWNSSTNSWSGGWNQWGWGGWSGGSNVDPKMAPDPSMSIAPLMDGYPVSTDGNSPMPGYTTGSAPTFQHGYWTAPQEQTNSRSSSRSRDRRSKSKNRDRKSSRSRSHREKPPGVAPVMEPIVMPTPAAMSTIDAAKRRQLPGWIREGLEKMEREKQRAIEREQEKKAREEAEKEKKRLEEEELERMKAVASGQPMLPAKSKFDTDSEGESDAEENPETEPAPRQKSLEPVLDMREVIEQPPLVRRSKEEIMQEVMLTVRRSLTEILLEVTDQEIHTVSQEELARYTVAQASRLNAMKASKSKALAAIASGLGLGAYESSSEESGDEDEQRDITDQQLQDIIKRKKSDFERTSREIEAEVRRAELREAGEDPSTPVATPERPRRSRSSATPPPVDSDTPEKIPERRLSKDKRNNHKSNDRVDGVRKLDVIPEEKPNKSNKRERTPTPPKNNNKTNQKENTETTSSDSEADSASSSSQSSSESEQEVKVEIKSKKRKRRSSSSSNSQKKSKKEKHKKEKSQKSDEKSSSKSKHHDDYDRTDKSRSKKKDDYYERRKSSRSRDYEKSHKDKYRDESDDDRQRKRSKRSRSVISYESRSGRKRSSRDRSEERSRRREKRSYDRDRSYDRSGRDYDKYDRYERSRDYDRRRSRSGSRSRHRR